MLRTVRSGQIQQILAAVLAIITAIGGIGIAGSSQGGNGGNNGSVVAPGDDGTAVPKPSGQGILLSTVPDNGEAVKGKVVVGGMEYSNAWSFENWEDHNFELNSEYSVLTASIGLVDGTEKREKTLHIGGKTFTVNAQNPTRTIRISVKDINTLKASSGGNSTKIALYNARLHK